MRGDQARESIFFKRVAAAGIPGRKAQKRVQQAKRHGEDDCLVIGDLVRNGEEICQQPRDGNPREEVNNDAAQLAEYGMHIRELILDDDSAHKAGAFHD